MGYFDARRNQDGSRTWVERRSGSSVRKRTVGGRKWTDEDGDEGRERGGIRGERMGMSMRLSRYFDGSWVWGLTLLLEGAGGRIFKGAGGAIQPGSHWCTPCYRMTCRTIRMGRATADGERRVGARIPAGWSDWRESDSVRASRRERLGVCLQGWIRSIGIVSPIPTACNQGVA